MGNSTIDTESSGTDRTGVWLVGAYGNVATSAIVGACAIADGVLDTTGMVTERAPCTELDLPAVEGFVFGGHDIRETTILTQAKKMAQDGTPNPAIVEAVADELEAIDQAVERGTAINCGNAVDTLADETLDGGLTRIIDEIQADLRSFQDRHSLDRVVLVNLASTEPTLGDTEQYATVGSFETALETNDPALPASSLYAYAALDAGHPYINFTPSTGSSLGGLRELAERNGVPHMGRDAKTGETLIKTALGPMFAARNLDVLSWEGHNILGNTDGKVLDDEENKAGKLASKGDVLDSILEEPFHNRVRIDYTPSLGDRKTAWDHIHFRGFFDTKMKMQFTWEGSDSALAAPLVLDLVRLIAHADKQGLAGTQPHLASFFKSPADVDEHDLSNQFAMLSEYVDRHADDSDEQSPPRKTPAGEWL